MYLISYFKYSTDLFIFNMLYSYHIDILHKYVFNDTYHQCFQNAFKTNFRNNINSLNFFANLRFFKQADYRSIGTRKSTSTRTSPLYKMSQRDGHTAIVTLYAYQTVGQTELGNLHLYPRNDLYTLPMHLLNEYLIVYVDLLGALLNMTK